MSQKKTQNSNGKQWPWMVLVILFAGLGAIACDNDPKPEKKPESYTPSAHLGQNETCPNSTQCTIKDYRTNATSFPQAINRVGKLDNYGNDEQAIKNAAKAMEQAYTAIKGDSEAKARFDNLLATASQITSTGNHNLASGLLKISTVDGNDIVIFLKKPAHGAASWNTEHLGIGESCLGASCSLQDYMPPAKKASFPEKAINRYGKEINYLPTEPGDTRTADKVIRDTADIIIGVYNDLIAANGGKGGKHGYTALMGMVDKVCVVRAQNLYYTFGKDKTGTKIFGVDPRNEWSDWTKDMIVIIMEGEAPLIEDEGIANNIVVQLQPTNAVRVANETRTEQPVTEQPVVAEGGDKEPKLNTVAQRFERMNRSAIARNNRNMV